MSDEAPKTQETPPQGPKTPAPELPAQPPGNPPAQPPATTPPTSPVPPEPPATTATEPPNWAEQIAAMQAQIEALKSEKDNKIKELENKTKSLEADRMAQKEAKRRQILGNLNPIFEDVYGWAPDAKTADPDTPEGVKALNDWAASKKELFRGQVAPQPTVGNNGDKRTFNERLQAIFGGQQRTGFQGLKS